MFTTYIIYSKEFDKFYIGQTKNIQKRLQRHNSGREKYTKKFMPWELVCFFEFKTRSEAVKYEKYLKSLKSKIKLKEIVEASQGGSSIA